MTIPIRYYLVGALFLLILLALTACVETDASGNQTVDFDPGGQIGAMQATINGNARRGTYVRSGVIATLPVRCTCTTCATG